MKWVQNGILNGKREKIQEKWRESPYIFLSLKGKKKESIEKVNLLSDFSIFSYQIPLFYAIPTTFLLYSDS